MKKIITLVLAACMMLTSFCALAESDKYTIVVMPKQVGITYLSPLVPAWSRLAKSLA